MSKQVADPHWFYLQRHITEKWEALLCPITSQVKGYPFEVLIPDGLEVQGAILSDQVKSLDWRARKAAFSCKLPPEPFNEAIKKLSTLIREQH
jgi:mRNA interferase MazF